MNFDAAFTRLVGLEGAYVDDPHDRGGETKYGISKKAYPGEDIPGMTLERAKTIYLHDYWGPAGCDAVPDALKFDLFDMAVNAGVREAIKVLQNAIGEMADGVLGPRTLQALQSMPAERAELRFNAGRLLHYTASHDWPAFGRGWVNRVAANMLKA